MGCGKSTIGKRVAKRLGYGFMDTDVEVERLAGKSIADIFRENGEEEFRLMETKVISDIPSEGDIIIATGGGTPCFNGNMALMKEKGGSIYFKVSPEVLLNRVGPGRSRRPKIAGMDDVQLLEYIRTALAEREYYYSQASMVIDCNGVADEYIARHVEYFIENSVAGTGR